MEQILPKQSVIIKCDIRKSGLLGNYEFYYAAGLLSRLAGKPQEPAGLPQELYERLIPLMDSYQTDDERVGYLVKMLQNYRVAEAYDEDMEQLFLAAYQEPLPWK